jgi:MFS family permease
LNLVKALTPLCRRNLLTLFAAGMLFWASLTLFLPTLPLYVQHVGGSPAEVGRVIGGFTLGLLLFRPRLARLADQKGRKPVLLIGIAAVALAPLGYLMTDQLVPLFGVRIFHGISVAGLTLAYSALVADLAPLPVRSEVLSYMSLTTPTGMSLGPALGSVILARWGYGPLFCTATVLGLLSFVLALQLQEPRREQYFSPQGSGEGTARPRATDGFWGLLRSPAIWVPTAMMLLIGLAFGTLMTFTALYLESEAISFSTAQGPVPLTGGIFFSTAALTGFALRLFSGLAVRQLGQGLLMSLGMVSYGIAMALLFVAQTPEIFLLAAILEGGGFGLLIPMLAVLLANRSGAAERGRIFGLCLLGLDLGGAIAAPLFGEIANSQGYRPLFAIGAVMVFLAQALFTTRSNARLSDSLRFSLGQGQDHYAVSAVPPAPGLPPTQRA